MLYLPRSSAAHTLPTLLWFKDLLGSELPSKLRTEEHPLAEGLGALKSYLSGHSLSREQELSLRALEAIARIVHDTEQSWRPHSEQFVSDLSHRERCQSLLFELHTIREAVTGTTTSINGAATKQALVTSRSRSHELASNASLFARAHCARPGRS